MLPIAFVSSSHHRSTLKVMVLLFQMMTLLSRCACTALESTLQKVSSLRMRLMFGAAITVLLFMLALFPALQQIFIGALEDAIEQRLAADASSLISAARIAKIGRAHV